MRIKKLRCYAFIICLILYVLGAAVYSAASTYNDKENINQHQSPALKGDYKKSFTNYIDEYPDSPNLLKWDIEVDNKVFRVYVNTYDETITVCGQAEDWEQKEKVEKKVNMRAPTNYRIIYQISVNEDSDKG